MSEEQRRNLTIDPSVEVSLGLSRGERKQQAQQAEELKPERKPPPHEIERKARQMSVTFPTPEWKRAIAEQADKWDMRPSDLLVYCVSYTMQAIETGRVKRPKGRVGRFYHRAGEAFDLRWEP